MNQRTTIYHGSRQIITRPEFGIGRKHNDYGQGFYCTMNNELAKEWACPVKKNGFSNQYTLNMEGLNVLYLTKEPFCILHWLAILLKNRTFDINNNIGSSAREYLMQNFMPDLQGVDVMVGYRADDSYFSFAEDFVNNMISVRDLNYAMGLGALGEQIVLLSEQAFSHIEFVGYETVDYREYYYKRAKRDERARTDYKMRKKDIAGLKEDIFVMDIIREDMKYDDIRLQSHLFG